MLVPREFKSASGTLEVGDLLDPSNPIVLGVVLPTLTLALLGFRQTAVLYAVVCAGFLLATKVL